MRLCGVPVQVQVSVPPEIPGDKVTTTSLTSARPVTEITPSVPTFTALAYRVAVLVAQKVTSEGIEVAPFDWK